MSGKVEGLYCVTSEPLRITGGLADLGARRPHLSSPDVQPSPAT
jgi:hypothetical protein